jgi:chromosome segregation ATPase
MKSVIQENAGLRDELDKEVRINQENEAKIKRLLAQQNQYEKSINYLYTVIEKLEVQSDSDNKAISDLKLQLSETLGQLKRCEKVSDDREKFIQYRESQLLEFEDTICNLKARIAYLAKLKKMDHTHTDIPADLTDKSTDELVGIITERAQYLYNKIDRICHVHDTKLHADQAKQRLIMASRQLHIKFLEQLRTAQDDVKHAQESRLLILDERNVIQEEYDKQSEKLKNCQEDLALFKNQYTELKGQHDEHYRNYIKYKNLVNVLTHERNDLYNERDNLTEQLRRADIKANHWKTQYTNCTNERNNLRTERNDFIIANQRLQRNVVIARTMIERLINQRQREVAALRIQIYYLRHQIRNMPPVINVPQQQLNTIWLLLQ